MNAIIIILIAISLSMDAFSLSLAYGTLNINKKDIYLLSSIVGIYHFFMPLIGMFFGSLLLNIIPITPNIMVGIVLIFIGIEMIEESKKEQEVKIMNFFELLLFGLAVSLDSFSIGLGLKSISNHYWVCALTFSLFSTVFTYCGLIFGKKINNKIGGLSTFIGGIILILIGIFSFFS